MIIILDYGSQTAELIARRVRECHVYSEVVPHTMSLDEIKKKFHPQGIILSGGPSSVYDQDAPHIDPAILNGSQIPILGICYGMQLMAQVAGGEVQRGQKQEFGKAHFYIDDNFDLFEGLWMEMTVWMSHGDSVIKMPPGFNRIGHTENTAVAAMANRNKRQFGVQFHPEVVHTPKGFDIIRNFVYKVCNCQPSWNMESFVRDQIREIRNTVKKDKVLLGLSGGVDSTTLAALLHKAIGDQLTCMFIDQGFMRKGESDRIVTMIRENFRMNLVHVNAADRFYKALEGITDPEEKRKKIGNEFVRVFETEMVKLNSDHKFLAQGTLYPDVIESAVVGVAKTAVKIKTHHNVGGLPSNMKFQVLEPLKRLFKDEVRRLGVELQVPDFIVWRQPFPGPGLAIRVLGPVNRERVHILQEADRIVMEEVKKAGIYRKLWQAFAVLLPIQTVGVQGDKRTYSNTVALRAVTSEDAMTANWAHLPFEILESISTRITNEVPEINRVVYDITNKPPATIEWE